MKVLHRFKPSEQLVRDFRSAYNGSTVYEYVVRWLVKGRISERRAMELVQDCVEDAICGFYASFDSVLDRRAVELLETVKEETEIPFEFPVRIDSAHKDVFKLHLLDRIPFAKRCPKRAGSIVNVIWEEFRSTLKEGNMLLVDGGAAFFREEKIIIAKYRYP